MIGIYIKTVLIHLLFHRGESMLNPQAMFYFTMSAENVNFTLHPEENLRNHILMSLRQIKRDLEQWPEVQSDISDYALYKLEHMATTILQIQGIWPNCIDSETLQSILKAYEIIRSNQNQEAVTVLKQLEKKEGKLADA